MIEMERKAHWENVFRTKDTSKVSWHQPVPETSLQLIDELNLSESSKIIEVGAGDSFLSDYLLERGFSEITVLDISEKALNTIKKRLGNRTNEITFLAQDILTFSGNNKFNLWHDRAVFHFLTNETEIEKYVENASNSLVSGGYFIISTFSANGPDSCSDLNVQQYSEKELTETFENNFRKIKCFTENHTTPSKESQSFTYCVFQRK